jgi:hypothetical protein
MAKFFKSILFCLLFSVLASSTIWDNWNIQAGAPGFVASNPPYSVTPPLSSGPFYFPWIRYKDSSNTIPGISFGDRKNQYMYILNSIPALFDGRNCKVYCGIRSFLVMDSYGNLVC